MGPTILTASEEVSAAVRPPASKTDASPMRAAAASCSGDVILADRATPSWTDAVGEWALRRCVEVTVVVAGGLVGRCGRVGWPPRMSAQATSKSSAVRHTEEKSLFENERLPATRALLGRCEVTRVGLWRN